MGRTKTFVREDVLDAAMQLFWEKGFADTSLSDLEKATGVNKSGLYSEFKDKEDIFHQCLKRYQDTHPGYRVLGATPLGWQNIENFLKGSMTCKGKKGCFMSNSLRDYAIIPQKTKSLMSENGALVHELIVNNLKAAGVRKNIETMANLIMTFASGLSLKLNAMRPEELIGEVDGFLAYMRR